MPPRSRITAVRDDGPRVQLNGYVQSTPAAIRDWVESQSSLQVVASYEDAGEVQLLVTDGTWRTFIKARAICRDASVLAEVIAPADAEVVLPTPPPD